MIDPFIENNLKSGNKAICFTNECNARMTILLTENVESDTRFYGKVAY